VGASRVVQLLLDLGDPADKDDFGMMTLHWAARNGREKIMRRLLEIVRNPQEKDDYNKTALHWAVEENHMTVVLLLDPQAQTV
jgi:ankyrin repeat protein